MKNKIDIKTPIAMNRQKIVAIAAFLLTSLWGGNALHAQDPHFSQFDAMPILLNPANTGMGDVTEMRIGLQYRSQWASMGSNFMTTAASFELPFQERFGVGASLQAYNAADVFSSINFMLSGAFLISDPSQRNFQLTTGLQIGFLYNRINTNDLIFENQFNGTNFDPDLPNGEFLDRRSTFNPDASIGFNYVNTNDRKKMNPHGGFSVFHLTHPRENFTGEKSRKPLRYVVHGGVRINVNREFSIDPRVVYMRQRNAQVILFGVMTNVELRQPFGLVAGAFYRYGDALIIQAGLQHNKNIYRISYDINTSSLSSATNNKGAIEVSILYTPGRKRRNRF